MAKHYLHITAHQDLCLPFNNYNQQTPKNNLTSKLNPKNNPAKKAYRKSHINNQLEAVNLQIFA